MKSISVLWWMFFLLFFFAPHLNAQIPDRRADGSSDEFGWLVVPAPVKVEGIGEGVVLFGLLTNIYETTDLLFVNVLPGGDFKGQGAQFLELPLLTRHLQLTAGTFNFEASFVLYDRGIKSDPDNYIQPLTSGSEETVELGFNLFKERFRAFYQKKSSESTTLKVYDKKGELLSKEKSSFSFDGESYGAILDFTDDPVDPRIGLRLGQRVRPIFSDDRSRSDIQLTDTDVSAYIPMWGEDTLTLNVFTSVSDITRRGITDEPSARLLLDQGCGGNAQCLAGEDKLVADFLAYNRYGAATPLGGPNRLRAYPINRFIAGNSSYLGMEYRLNFNEKPTPVNWWLLGGVRTLLQVAFFYEQGTVAELQEDLNKNMKTSYGAGLRALISGFVYRFDVAQGDEGTGVTLLFEYPMELIPLE